jgi:glycosyltransferase involved in cell wall biosynthesis
MKIALLSTCALATPPRAYGGTELVVAELARGLVELGHEVTVFATADSRPAGRLCPCSARPVWPPSELAELRHAAQGWRAISRERFDVVHVNHAAALPLNRIAPRPCVMTLHHVRDDALLQHYAAYPEIAYVAISHRQAELIPELDVAAVVHHGLDPARYPEGAGRGGYCAFLARFAREKGPHVAIDAARAANVPLRLAGSPHAVDNAQAYFRTEVVPRLDGDSVRWVGEVTFEPKLALLGDARALLMPIAWEEPFGLNMIESMLVGTPVIAFRAGSVPEIVDEGVTGYVVDTVEQMADRLRTIDAIDRRACRARALERWSYRRMAAEYVSVYERVRIRAGRRGRKPHLGARNPPLLAAASPEGWAAGEVEED